MGVCMGLNIHPAIHQCAPVTPQVGESAYQPPGGGDIFSSTETNEQSDSSLWSQVLATANDPNHPLAPPALHSRAPLLSSSSGTPAQLPPAAAATLPPLATLDAHLVAYPPLAALLHNTIGVPVHPHAIHGDKLRQLRDNECNAPDQSDTTPAGPSSNAPFGASSTALNTPEIGLNTGGVRQPPLDVVSVVEDWVAELEAVSGALSSLLPPPQQQQQQQQQFSSSGSSNATYTQSGVVNVPSAESGGGATVPQPPLHPLLAPASDSASHAALLATQLRAHQGVAAQLRDMRTALRGRLLDAGVACLPACLVRTHTVYPCISCRDPSCSTRNTERVCDVFKCTILHLVCLQVLCLPLPCSSRRFAADTCTGGGAAGAAAPSTTTTRWRWSWRRQRLDGQQCTAHTPSRSYSRSKRQPGRP